eukprot:358657-Chlamydomonas_euryale.AAC.2
MAHLHTPRRPGRLTAPPTSTPPHPHPPAVMQLPRPPPALPIDAQFYANAGASPDDIRNGAPLPLPPRAPASAALRQLPTPDGTDAWQLRTLYTELGRGCGTAVRYADTCGGLSQPRFDGAFAPCGAPAGRRRSLLEAEAARAAAARAVHARRAAA